LLLLVGPSIIWCPEFIGSGEVILATRTGAILGIGVIWAVWLIIGLYVVMPRFYTKPVAGLLRPH